MAASVSSRTIGIVSSPPSAVALEPFVQVATDLRDHDLSPGSDGLDRDSGDALEDVSTHDFGADLTWQPTGSATRVSARLDRTIEETTVEDASFSVRTVLGGGMMTALRPDLSAFR